MNDSAHDVKVEVAHEEREPPSGKPPIVRTNSYLEENHVRLGWRSWMVVFVTSFA